MTTTETAKRTSTKYFIDYVANVNYGLFYYRVVRTSDEAILYSNELVNNVKIWCWENNIPASEVTIW